jgi:hypothetical protein
MATVTATKFVLQDNQGADRVVLEIDGNNHVQISLIARTGRKAVHIHESFEGDGVLYLNGDGCAIQMNAQGQLVSVLVTGGATGVSPFVREQLVSSGSDGRRSIALLFGMERRDRQCRLQDHDHEYQSA